MNIPGEKGGATFFAKGGVGDIFKIWGCLLKQEICLFAWR